MRRLLTAMAHALERLSFSLNRLCWALAVFFLVAMFFTVGIQVVARYIFFSPPSWTEELARYCMIWAGLLGATVSYYRREDPVLVNTPNPSSKWAKAVFKLIRVCMVLILIVPLVYYSPVTTSHHLIRLTESMQINSAFVFIIVPIFATVILVHVLSRILNKSPDRNESLL